MEANPSSNHSGLWAI